MFFDKNKIKDYYNNVKNANLELAKKEHFKDLLVRIFDEDKNARKIIDSISAGSEKTIYNIPLDSKLTRGSADTQYRNVIIEFEANLKKTGKHAKEQLANYLAGNILSGEVYNYTLIATDCIEWIIYSPDSENFLFDNIKSGKDVELKDVDRFVLTEKNISAFPFFLDRYLFKTQKQKTTQENISFDFGESSVIFLQSIKLMKKEFLGFNNNSELLVAYEQWQKFLSIAYGKYDASEEVFLVHTYMSIFSKILAFTVLTKKVYADEEELKSIITGEIFIKLNVKNFVDNDFYHWVGIDENFEVLKPVFDRITYKLDDYDLSSIDEDILKGIYQGLIDIETRHSLGEYYTPDWLCKEIVGTLEFKRESTILDPACGSGSFLLASINKLKNEYPDITAEDIVKQVIGIDIHPLSVQISKTTIILAIGEKLVNAKRPIFLGVFLANSLLMPEKNVGLFGTKYRMLIDKTNYEIDTSIFENTSTFDNSISLCDELASYSASGDSLDKNIFINHFADKKLLAGLNEEEIKSFYRIYEGLKKTKEAKRDIIWKFIIQNIYKPFFLKEQFDFVIGNPPWITYSDFANKSYQETLYRLAEEYNLIPSSVANMPHLEIAAIFLSHSTSFFLKNKGKIAFVLPRSFLSADHHDNSRSGKALGFKLTEIWDLKDVSPLFKVPACVLFADKSPEEKKGFRAIPKSGILGMSFSGNPNYETIVNDNFGNEYFKVIQDANNLRAKNIKWYYSILGASSALTTNKVENKNRINYYRDLFKQGATIVPRNFYFIEVEKSPLEKKVISKKESNKIVFLKTSDAILSEAKKPWKDFILKGCVNSDFLFITALSKNVVPFAYINPISVLLPIFIRNNESTGENSIEIVKAKEIFEKGDLDSSRWFGYAEKIWEKHKTEKSEKMSIYDRLNFQRGLTEQNINKSYLVLYTASSKDANSVIIKRSNYDSPFIAESKTYWYATDEIDDAYFVCAFLNSNYPNKKIKDFQSTGLFGARDVHKKILEVPLPFYNNKNKMHQGVVGISRICESKVKEYLKRDFEKNLTPLELGKIRLEIRKHLNKELIELDKILKEI